jgi:hypothetical protein
VPSPQSNSQLAPPRRSATPDTFRLQGANGVSEATTRESRVGGAAQRREALYLEEGEPAPVPRNTTSMPAKLFGCRHELFALKSVYGALACARAGAEGLDASARLAPPGPLPVRELSVGGNCATVRVNAARARTGSGRRARSSITAFLYGRFRLPSLLAAPPWVPFWCSSF